MLDEMTWWISSKFAIFVQYKTFLYSKNMANLEMICLVISSSINLLFLKSACAKKYHFFIALIKILLLFEQILFSILCILNPIIPNFSYVYDSYRDELGLDIDWVRVFYVDAILLVIGRNKMRPRKRSC